ncbi:hypothetical protein AKJ39_02985, partial [candidate division MSBL1 archaeon SCGC-AAA259J03]
PNIKERKDESCALFTPGREMLVQAEHIPVHLGAMPMAVESALSECEPGAGDQVIFNDPFSGGTHLPDITLIKPVHREGTLLGFAVNRAHHGDIGGETPGSMPGHAERLEDEGAIISPRLAVKGGKVVEETLRMLSETRSPGERTGDLRAQIGANEKGARELNETVEKFGLEEYRTFTDQYLDYTESLVRNTVEDLPNRTYSAEEELEWKGRNPSLQVEVSIEGERMSFDFGGTDGQVDGNVNAPLPVTRSAVYYVLQSLLGGGTPFSEGSYRPLQIEVPEGSILNAAPPAAVSAGNVETSQRVVELLLRALQPALPGRIPAESMGTMNNLTVGNDNFTYYETIGGGTGASPQGDGESGVHVHMTNTSNTPVEALENSYPLQVEAYHIRRETGGEGLYRGGDGLLRRIRVLENAQLSVQSQRRKIPPQGVEGGKPGERGENLLIRKDGEREKLGNMVTKFLEKGSKLEIKTPGGGGWGKPQE